MTRRAYAGAICVCLMALLAVLAVATGGGRYLRHPRRLLRGVTTVKASSGEVEQINQGPVRRYRDPVKPKRLDAWEIIGPGGGGAFYHVTVSPHDPNLVAVSTDMTECYITENGGVTWREFNLRAVSRFTFDPKLPDRIYALARSGGLWRSDDRGHTWSLVYPDPAITTAVWYMDDEGEPLLQTSRGFVEAVSGFEVDPDNSDTLYGLMANALQVSNDAGKHWRVLSQPVQGQALYVDPSSPKDKRRVFVAGGSVTGVWDGSRYSGPLKIAGSTWFYGVAFGASKDGTPSLYTANDYHFTKDGAYADGGILASHDGGVTWESRNAGLLARAAPATAPEFSSLGASLFHPEVLYASTYHLRLPNDPKRYQGVLKTPDGGVTWDVVRKESDAIAPNIHESWLSYRFGPDWGENPLSIGVSPKDPNLVYTTDLGRVMKSVDGGKTWDALYSQGVEGGYTTTGLDVTTCYGVHFDPFDSKRMFISYTDIGLFASEDGGKSWNSATTQGVPRGWVNTTYWVQFDPQVKGRVWAAMSGTHDIPRRRMFRAPDAITHMHGGVVTSDDGGKTWRVTNHGLPEMAATHILLDPKSPPSARVLYATGFGQGVFKSTDGGQNWTSKSRGLPAKSPLTWRMALGGDGALYVVTIRRSQDGTFGNDQDGWLFRSKDGAETWEKVALPEGLNGPMGITVDPQDPSRLYLAAWGRYKLYAAGILPPMGGVFLSVDGGAHWTNVLDASRRIYDVTVDPRNSNVVYAVGFEASAWRSTDRGLTWKRIPGFNFKDGHRVIPDPNDPAKIYIATFGSSVWHGPAAGDPEAAEDIAAPAVLRFNAKAGGKAK